MPRPLAVCRLRLSSWPTGQRPEPVQRPRLLLRSPRTLVHWQIPSGGPQKLLYSFFSSVASSDDDSACRKSNPDSGKTRCVACRCSETPPSTAELPPAYVAWALETSFLWSSSYLNTDKTPRTGVLLTFTFEQEVILANLRIFYAPFIRSLCSVVSNKNRSE